MTPLKIGEIIFGILYMIFVFWLGISSKKKAEESGEKYFASSKFFGAIMIGVATATVGMSAFGFVGGAGLNYATGMWLVMASMFFTISYGLMMWMNGKPMRMMGEIANIETYADLGYERYRDNAIRFFIALNLIICVWAYMGTQIEGAGYIMNAIFGMPVTLGGIVIVLYTVLYTVLGGMIGSIKVDALQGVLKLLCIVGMVIGFFYITHGPTNAITTIAASPHFGPRLVDPMGLIVPLAMSWIFVLGLGVMGQPQVSTKLYGLNSYKALKTAGLIGGISYALMCVVYFFPGTSVLYLVASGAIPAIQVKDTTVFAFMNQLPPVLSVMVYLGLLAASMATTSTFLVIGSSLFTRDIPRSFGKNLDQKQEVVVGRWALLIISLGALTFGLFGGQMVAILGGIGLGTFVATSIPVIVGYQWRKATREAALIAEVLTLVLSIGFTVVYEGIMKGKLMAKVPGYAYIILISIVVMIFASFFTKGAAGDLLPAKMKVYFKHME